MQYDRHAIAAYFDELGLGEWERLVRSPTDEVKLHLHEQSLRSFVPRGARVLEVGAGPGRFTSVLAELDCRIIVSDVSRVQLDLNRRHGVTLGYADAVEEWVEADVCDLGMFDDESFDAVVAYGGPISYALDAREIAVQECRRVVEPGGLVLLSVMSLWGTVHSFLTDVMRVPAEINRTIIATGDLTPETNPGHAHRCHMFTSDELGDLLERNDLHVLQLSASNALSSGWDDDLADVRASPEKWNELLAMELEACTRPGCRDMGTHIIGIARR